MTNIGEYLGFVTIGGVAAVGWNKANWRICARDYPSDI